MPKVSLIHGEDRRQNVFSSLIDISGGAGPGSAGQEEVQQKLLDAETVLIKCNLVDYRNQLASTHIDAVRGVIDFVRTMSKAQIIVGDSGYHGTKEAFRAFGFEALTKEYQRVGLLDLNEDALVEGFYTIKRDGSHNPIKLSRTAVEADVKICLTQMKTHRDVGVSLTIKNWTIGTWIPPKRIGPQGYIWARWPWLHEEGTVAHNKTIAELYKQIKPDIGVIDAYAAMQGDGPTNGEPVYMRVALAGTDCLAIDSVACSLMGIDPHDIGYLYMLSESDPSVGELEMKNIDVPALLIGQLCREFVKPDSFEENVLSWKG